MTKRWIAVLASLACALPAWAQVSFPHSLVLDGRVDARLVKPGIPSIIAGDDVYAEARSGDDYAAADMITGTLRGAVASTDVVGSEQSFAGLSAFFYNPSAAVALFAPGSVTMNVSALFGRTLGSGSFGIAANTFTAALVIAIVDADGNERVNDVVSFVLSVTDEADSGPGQPDVTITAPDDYRLVHETTGGSVDIQISAPMLELRPGDAMAIGGMVSGSATAFDFFGGTGYSAFLDYGNTAELGVDLPAGFALDADIPLDWITTTPIPEPATALMFAVGALGLGLGRGFSRRVARPRGRSPRSWSARSTPPPAA